MALSPMILPTDKIHPVTIPSTALGRTTVRIICHFPAPRREQGSLHDSCSELFSGFPVLFTIIVGNVIITSVNAPAIRLVPSEQN